MKLPPQSEIDNMIVVAEGAVLLAVSSGIAVTPRFIVECRGVGPLWVVALACDQLAARGRVLAEWHYDQRMFRLPGAAEEVNQSMRPWTWPWTNTNYSPESVSYSPSYLTEANARANLRKIDGD